MRMNRRTGLWLLILVGVLLLVTTASVRAEDPPPTTCGDKRCDIFRPVEGCPGGVRILSAS
jgi:hypothetical protein